MIFGFAAPVLTEDEKRFFADCDPLGFIVFARNIRDPDRLRATVAELRALVGREDAPVLVDQEGGRVQRLGPPHWRKAPPAAVFEPLGARDPVLPLISVRLNSRLMALDMRAVGIDVDCHPVADVPVDGSHDIIGDRAYSRDPARAAELARAACDGLLDGGVLPVIKHLPGHGRAVADSHLELPVVTAPADVLAATDLVPFRALADQPWGMTAHVVYTAYDPDRPATLSPTVVGGVIRGDIGFDGLLLTDDLSMKALSGSFAERTGLAFAAGCDVALHCNADPAEMAAIAAAAPRMSDAALDRFARGSDLRRRRLAEAGGMDVGADTGRLEAWLA